jgi:hypothetical protein
MAASTLSRPAAWYDFVTIRARMEKLLREREGEERGERDRGKGQPRRGVNRVSQLARPCAAATAGGQTAPRRSKRSEPARRD